MHRSIELSYPVEADIHVSNHAEITPVAGVVLDVETGTDSGRYQPDDAQKPNEDSYSVTSNGGVVTAAIFDGASSQKRIPELGETSGARYASHTLKSLFEAMDPTNPANTLRQLNDHLGQELAKFPSVNLDDLNSLPTSTATILELDFPKNLLTFAHVGDSFAITKHIDGTTTLLTNNLHRPFDEKVLQLILDIAHEEGTNPREARSNPRIREAIMAMFQTTRNRPDGTGEGMVNSDPNMSQYIQTSSIALNGIETILLGSDGLVPPNMDERKTEDRDALMKAAAEDGLTGLIKQTRTVEDADPDRWHIRYKHADDATGILIRINRT